VILLEYMFVFLEQIQNNYDNRDVLPELSTLDMILQKDSNTNLL
jgi:hypothetical protein